MIVTILMVLAFVLLAVCAAGVPSPPRFQLGWAGLAVWALAIVLGGLGGLKLT
jgi:hypothetical protein